MTDDHTMFKTPERYTRFLLNLDDQLSRVQVEAQIARDGVHAMLRHLGFPRTSDNA